MEVFRDIDEVAREYSDLCKVINSLEESKKDLSQRLQGLMKQYEMKKYISPEVGNIHMITQDRTTLDKSSLKQELTRFMSVNDIEDVVTKCSKVTTFTQIRISALKGDDDNDGTGK